jgi:polysaccharide pyruvyl transferase CsaB
MKRVLFSGYYGFDNAGDEAVLAGLISGLKQSAGSNDISTEALSIAPGRTTKLHHVPASHRYGLFLPAILRCDLLLSGGGSLLQDVTSAHGIFYYLAVVRIAQLLGRKTMFIAQGIGPLIRDRSRRLTASVANRLDAITVRDTESAQLLRAIGVSKEVVLSADPALLLMPPKNLVQHGILLSVRPWSNQAGLATVVADALSLSRLAQLVTALNMYGEGDRIAAQQILRKLPSANHSTPYDNVLQNFREMFVSVAEAEMVVGMRLHSLIFAAACGVPSVALSYDPKVDAFMAQSGQQDAVFNVSNHSAEELASRIEYVWTQRVERRQTLLSNISMLRNAALVSTNTAVSVLFN